MSDDPPAEFPPVYYGLLLENLPHAVFLKDPEGRFLYVNDQFCSLIGRKRDAVIGRCDEDLFPTEFAAKFRRDDAYVMAKKAAFEVIEENPDPDGRMRHVQVIKKPLVKDGEILGVQGMFWDVTDKFRAEEKSRVNEERFRTVARATTDTVWDWDLVTNHVWWSEGLRSVWGYTDEQIEKTTDWWMSRLHPDDRERVLGSVRQALAGNDEHWSAEYRYQAADGSYRTILDRGLIMRDKAGQAIRMIGSELDLSDRIAAQQALKQSEARFRSFMDNCPAVAWVKDRSHCLRYVNAAYEEMFQSSAGELVGKNEGDFMPTEVAESIQKNDRTVMATGKPLQMVEHVPDSEGRMRHWLVSKFPFPGDGGEEWVGGMAFEITDSVKAEKALRESEERLRLTLRASQDAMWDLDFAGNEVWWNQAHEELLGPLPSRADEVRAWRRELLHPDDCERVGGELQASLDDPEIIHWSADYRIRGVDGEYRFIQDRALISRAPGGEVNRIVGAVRDLTPFQKEQEAREKMGQKLLEAQKLESLGVLAGGIAHDFNNLLTSILGNVNLAQLELPSTSLVHPYLDDVEKASIRAADLCKQMLAYSGRGRFVVKRVGLTAVVEEMMQLLQVSISKQAILKYNLAKDLPAVAADPTQLRQIMMNLVINASEAISEKSGSISISTGLMRADRDYLKETYLSPNIPEGDYVFLEISDSGCGMDKATLDRIFDPFFTTKFTGRGLGLAAVLGIVRGHRGALKVYSEPRKGTTFKLLLPCAEGVVERAGSGLMPLARTKGEGLILVVDDEETVRTTSARMLESAGYTVNIAADGCEGVDAFREQSDQVRLVLLDLTMPHLDGVETFREIRRIRSDACVVLMSGYNEQEAIQRFIGKGLAGFIQKPFQIQSLLGKVKEVLDAEKK